MVCKDFYGGTLASIHSDDEQKFLTKLAFTTYKANNHVWIGARRISNDTFVWEDKSPFNYTNWAKSQPNNLEGKHYCTSLLQSTNLAELGNWYDDPCSDKYNFFCQKYISTDPSSESTSPPPATTSPASVPTKPSSVQRTNFTSRITLFDLRNSNNRTALRANSSTISALIASESKMSGKTEIEKSNNTALSVLIVVVVVQFTIIAALIYVAVRRQSILPPYRVFTMSECNRNAPLS